MSETAAILLAFGMFMFGVGIGVILGFHHGRLSMMDEGMRVLRNGLDGAYARIEQLRSISGRGGPPKDRMDTLPPFEKPFGQIVFEGEEEPKAAGNGAKTPDEKGIISRV